MFDSFLLTCTLYTEITSTNRHRSFRPALCERNPPLRRTEVVASGALPLSDASDGLPDSAGRPVLPLSDASQRKTDTRRDTRTAWTASASLGAGHLAERGVGGVGRFLGFLHRRDGTKAKWYSERWKVLILLLFSQTSVAIRCLRIIFGRAAMYGPSWSII